MPTVVADPEVTPATAVAVPDVSPMDEIVREGARRMLAAALKAEVAACARPVWIEAGSAL